MSLTRKYKILFFVSLSISITTLILLIVGCCFLFSMNSSNLTATDVFDKAKNSVVEVKAESETYGTTYGSAVCIDDNLLITNAHVVSYSSSENIYVYDSISIRLYGSEDYYPVQIKNYDVDIDLCLIELETENIDLNPVSINYESTEAGDIVYAVGNAMNHGISITEGIVSIPLINVSVNDVDMLVIQCNITISNGSSGGALLNEKGELIGITTFRIRDQSGYIVYGVGFAIPTSTLSTFLN